MAHPIETLITRTDIIGTAGDNQLFPAPGENKRIVVTSFVIQNEKEQASVLMILRSGATINGWRFRAVSVGAYLSKDFAKDREWRLNWNEPLNLWLDGDDLCNCSFECFIEGKIA